MRIINFLSLGLSIVSIAIVLFFYNAQTKKIVVVDAIRLFNEFKMKIELEKIDGERLSDLGKKIDSLQTRLKINQSKNIIDEELINSYRNSREKLEIDYQESNQNINEQVWKRLNPLIDDYGKKNDFKMILGANGMGSVLYNDELCDETDDIIKYVNRIYEKGN